MIPRISSHTMKIPNSSKYFYLNQYSNTFGLFNIE